MANQITLAIFATTSLLSLLLFFSLIQITETQDPIKEVANFILDISDYILSGICIN